MLVVFLLVFSGKCQHVSGNVDLKEFKSEHVHYTALTDTTLYVNNVQHQYLKFIIKRRELTGFQYQNWRRLW